MAALSTFMQNKLIDVILRNTAYTGPATVYIALYTTATDAGSGGTEVTGTGYARVAATFSAGSGGVTSNSGAVTFGPATSSWGTITNFAVYDASTGGNRLFYGALTASKTINNGDSAQFSAGQFQITFT